jgi:RHS repeat-associated protein
VTKTAGGVATYYVYDAGGELLAEYGGPSNTVGGTVYQTEDNLGSTRAVTGATGSIVSRSDYLPFGETIAGTATFNRNQFLGYGPAEGTLLTFTEHVGDAESALDYFGARYFAGAMGRFTSADPEIIPGDITNPQAWNKYGYTYNNPFRYTDPDGKAPQDTVAGQNFERDARAVLSGQMSSGEFQARNASRAAGAAAGAGIVSGVAGGSWLWKFLFGASMTPQGQEEERRALELTKSTSILEEGAKLLTRATASAEDLANVGFQREVQAAEQLSGFVPKMANGQDLVVRGANVAARVDVMGDGFIGQVGGFSKSFNLSAFGSQINNLVKAANANNLRAIYVYTKDTPEAVLKIAKRAGAELVELH